MSFCHQCAITSQHIAIQVVWEQNGHLHFLWLCFSLFRPCFLDRDRRLVSHRCFQREYSYWLSWKGRCLFRWTSAYITILAKCFKDGTCMWNVAIFIVLQNINVSLELVVDLPGRLPCCRAFRHLMSPVSWKQQCPDRHSSCINTLSDSDRPGP